MGTDDMSVVDERLRVHGLQGLRIADASIMPMIVSGNTSIPCMMIGEKCADMILQDYADGDRRTSAGLAEHTPQRHDQGDRMTLTSTFTRVALAAAALALAATTQAAPVCADKTIRMVIPQPAGGVGDVVARMIGEKAGQVLEQPFLYENKPGASSTIGTAAAATAKPDGCTLLAHDHHRRRGLGDPRRPAVQHRSRLRASCGHSARSPMALTVVESSKFRDLC